jgi:hypothetical protein
MARPMPDPPAVIKIYWVPVLGFPVICGVIIASY